jgi:glycosyltransferase involved in cell wall biosynthesis
VVVFQWWQPFFALAYLGVIKQVRRSSDAQVFFLCHNIFSHGDSRFPGYRLIEYLLTRRAFPRVDGFLVQAQEMENRVREFNPAARIKRIYHPLYDFYSRWDRSEPPEADEATPHLLFFGTIRKYKGLETFLRALGLIKDRIPFRATVAGEFYVNPRPYRQLADQLSLSSRLVWKDHYIANEEVPQLFRSADLVVLPYLMATQSGVVPVAYQFEVPVIATNVGGLSEVVLEGETGYLVQAGDANALAEKIVRYFEEGKKQEFQKRIREFRSQLSWAQVVDSILELSRDERQSLSLA